MNLENKIVERVPCKEKIMEQAMKIYNEDPNKSTEDVVRWAVIMAFESNGMSKEGEETRKPLSDFKALFDVEDKGRTVFGKCQNIIFHYGLSCPEDIKKQLNSDGRYFHVEDLNHE